jgi:CO/xanthine dehydrogenase Mo-binding subunit
LAENPQLNQWIGFEADGTVRVATGKVELGQGLVTALAQIAAEELDVPLDRIRIISGETERSPDEWYTAGSLSIETSGTSIRLVCAEVRALFLDHLGLRLNCPATELSVTDGRFLRCGQETGLDYWALAESVDLARPASGTALAKHPREFRIVGHSIPRLDLPAKISRAPFLHDLAPAGILHARVLRQPSPGARLVSLDEGAVGRAAGGCVEVIRDGDFVAFLSDDERAAVAAATAAHGSAVWEGGQRLDPETGQARWLMAQPTVDRVIEIGAKTAAVESLRTIEAVYSRPFIAHASIGPVCALALYKDHRLSVWTQSQGVFQLRAAIAEALGLDARSVAVVHRQGAGCYGHNGADDVAFDAALLATRVPGRTVRVEWSREDDLSSAPFGSAMAIKMSAGLDRAGRPVDWTMEVWSGTHGQRPGMNGGVNLLGAQALTRSPPAPAPADVPDAVGAGGMRNAVALYDLAGQLLIHHFIPRLPVRTSSLRGLGAFANVFAIECFVDELAQAAGHDPVAYRLAMLSDPRARRVIETAAAMSDWQPNAESGSGRGKGLGFARYKNRSGYAAVVADVEVEETVRLLRAWCAVDAGFVINPDGLMNQIEGGIIQAASWTLKEEVRFAAGRIASVTWEDYPILRFSEVPEVEVEVIQAPGEPSLGVGEVAQGPTAAAIGNAVARALGARIRELPLTRDRIMSALLAA